MCKITNKNRNTYNLKDLHRELSTYRYLSLVCKHVAMMYNTYIIMNTQINTNTHDNITINISISPESYFYDSFINIYRVKDT